MHICLDLGFLLYAVVAEKLVHSNAEEIGDLGKGLNVGIAYLRLPTGYRLGSYAEVGGELVLGYIVILS